jgi:hypothetical protein
MNAELERHLQAIRAAQPGIDKLEARLKERKANVQEHLRNAQALLNAGAKPEDRYLGIAIRGHGLDQAIADRYRDLETRMKGRKGEFVAIEFVKDIPFKYSSDNVETARHTLFRIGVLASDSLIFEVLNESSAYKECTLPATQYLGGYSDQLLLWKSDVVRTPEKGNIFSGGGHYYEQPPSLRQVIAQQQACEIFIGNDEVRKWLIKDRHAEKFFKAAANALGMLILEPTDP